MPTNLNNNKTKSISASSNLNQPLLVSKTATIESFGISKLTSPLIKQFLSAFLAGICVGFGFTAMLVVIANMPQKGEEGFNPGLLTLAKYLASFIFGIAIIMCSLLGASLYTGNCVGFVPCLHKKVKWRYFFYNLLIVLGGNYLGTICFATLIFFTGLFASHDGNWFVSSLTTKHLIQMGIDKVTMPWWQTFFSGILCNIIIVAAIMAWVLLDNKAASVIIILFFIAAFVIGGYQHVVADMYITSISWFLSLLTGAIDFTSHAGELYYNCLIPATLGNLVGGSFITAIYFAIVHGVYKRRHIDPPSLINKDVIVSKTVDGNNVYGNSYEQKVVRNTIINSQLLNIEDNYKKLVNSYKESLAKIKLDYTNTTKAIQNNKNLSNEQKQKQLIKAIKAKDEKIRILKRATTNDSQQIKNEWKKILKGDKK